MAPVQGQITFTPGTFAENLASNPGPNAGDMANTTGSNGGAGFPIEAATFATSVTGAPGMTGTASATVIISGPVTLGGPAGAMVMVRAAYANDGATADKREAFGSAVVTRNISIGGTHVLQETVNKSSATAVGMANSALPATGRTGIVVRQVGDSFGVNIFSQSSTIRDATAQDAGLRITGLEGLLVPAPVVPGAPGPGLPGGFGAGGMLALVGAATAVGGNFSATAMFGDAKRDAVAWGADTVASPLADSVSMQFKLEVSDQATGTVVFTSLMSMASVTFAADEGSGGKTGTAANATVAYAGGTPNTAYVAKLRLDYVYDKRDGSGMGPHESLVLSTVNFTTAVVPEPAECAALTGLGLAGLAVWRRSRKAAHRP